MKKTALSFILWLCASFPAFAAYPQIEFQTNVGSFVMELYPDKAPKTVENFMQYVNSGHYEGTIFHRVIDKFIIQGGGMTPEMTTKPTKPPVAIESNNGLHNEPGAVAMARTYQPDTATSQFFINLDDNKMLNYYKSEPGLMGYTVFGKVIRGMDVARKIGQTPTRVMGKLADVPQEQILIQHVTLLDTPVIAEESSKPLEGLKAAPASTTKKSTKKKSTKKGTTRG